MKKLPIALSFLVGSALAASAATALHLTLADGSEATYILADSPVVTYPGTEMHIATDKVSVSYQRSEVAKIDFTDVDPSGVEEILAGTSDVMSCQDNVVSAPGYAIMVHDIRGALLIEAFGQVSLAGLPGGIYIVTAGKQSVKIMK